MDIWGKRISPVRPIWVTEKACCEKHCGSYWFSKNPEATRKKHFELFSAQNAEILFLKTIPNQRPFPPLNVFFRKIINFFFAQ